MTHVFAPGELVVKVQRWPVIARVAQPNTGRMTGYQRTAAPLIVREEKLIRLESRSRALVTWDIANAATFSLGTGRCIGNADWLLTDESRTELRKLARVQFPRKKKPKEAEASPEDEDDEGLSPMEIAGAPVLAQGPGASDAGGTEGG
jgi:hypothetical protein